MECRRRKRKSYFPEVVFFSLGFDCVSELLYQTAGTQNFLLYCVKKRVEHKARLLPPCEFLQTIQGNNRPTFCQKSGLQLLLRLYSLNKPIGGKESEVQLSVGFYFEGLTFDRIYHQFCPNVNTPQKNIRMYEN